ncbi:hypothetical protein ACWGB8_35810 [Kitasatospora sp. NPDC054939]
MSKKQKGRRHRTVDRTPRQAAEPRPPRQRSAAPVVRPTPVAVGAAAYRSAPGENRDRGR